MNKDIRDFIYLTNPIILTFKNERSYDDFYEWFSYNYYGFVLLDDMLALLGIESNFNNAGKYGWFVDDLLDALENIKYFKSYESGLKIIVTLPLPIKFDKKVYEKLKERYN